MNFIFRKFKNINEDLTSIKPLFLDSVISPSALNLEFYNKVNLLAPFGSGNPEPKFIIENLRAVNGKIVGEKHIKSVLAGSDSSIIKAISFNVTGTELSSYLLKKNIKNLAGKPLVAWPISAALGCKEVDKVIVSTDDDEISPEIFFQFYTKTVYYLL